MGYHHLMRWSVVYSLKNQLLQLYQKGLQGCGTISDLFPGYGVDLEFRRKIEEIQRFIYFGVLILRQYCL